MPLYPLAEWMEENLREWHEFLHEFFSSPVPEYKEWSSLSDIIDVINLVGSDQHHHVQLFLPTTGTLPLAGAQKSYETGCVELLPFGSKSTYALILHPKRLIFQSVGKDLQWAYFRLETNRLERSTVYENDDSQREELTEISPIEYAPRYAWDYGEYEGIPLQNARLVNRYLSGTFAIFAKGSIYNRLSNTNYAWHNVATNDDFKQVISDMMRHLA